MAEDVLSQTARRASSGPRAGGGGKGFGHLGVSRLWGGLQPQDPGRREIAHITSDRTSFSRRFSSIGYYGHRWGILGTGRSPIDLMASRSERHLYVVFLLQP